MGDLYVPAQQKLWIGEQATFGTAIDPAAGSWDMVHCAGAVITPDVNIIDVKADRGQRYKDIDDVHHTEDGAMPKVTISGLPVRMADLARFLMLFFHNCSEGTTPLFTNTFTLPTTIWPDFASNEGLFCSVIQINPAATDDQQVNDCICQKLTLKCSPKGLLTADIELVGRGSVTNNAAGSATPSEAAATFFTWEQIDRCTIDVAGGGANSVTPMEWQLELGWNKIIPSGMGGTGSFANFTLDEFTGKFTAPLAWDTTTKNLLSNLQTKARIEVNVGWGNASPGTVAADLDFALCGTFESVEVQRGDLLLNGITVDLKTDVANSKVPITAIIADSDEKGYTVLS